MPALGNIARQSESQNTASIAYSPTTKRLLLGGSFWGDTIWGNNLVNGDTAAPSAPLTVQGVVMDGSSPAARDVWAFLETDPPQVVGRATSDPSTGAFTIRVGNQSQLLSVYVVDNQDPPVRNTQVFAGVQPY